MMDLLLIAFALVSGALGIFLKKPPLAVQILLVSILVVSSALTARKTLDDARDKELLETLAIAGLALPNTAYDKVYAALDAALGEGASDGCLHTDQGMACSRDAADGRPASTLVLNRYEVARVYADSVRGKDTRRFLQDIANKWYDPAKLGDDYEDKLVILGFDKFYKMCRFFPIDYAYDDDNGVSIIYEKDSKRGEVRLSRDDMTGAAPAMARAIFGHFDELYGARIVAALPDCGKPGAGPPA